jgi:hypothetical protein
MRDEVARRTGYQPDVVAHVLDRLEEVVREELLQQGEVVFRGLFRIVPGRRAFPRFPGSSSDKIERITLTLRPVREFRKKLSAVLPPR